MRIILFVTDLSPAAYNAAKYVVQLAGSFKAKIIVLNSIAVTRPALANALFIDDDENELQNIDTAPGKLTGLINMLKTNISHETGFTPVIETVVKQGPVAKHIATICKYHHTDLIVTALTHHAGTGDTFFDTDVNAIINQANCPVLIVSEHTAYRKIKNIFYVTDLRYSNTTIVNTLIKIAAPFKAVVSLMHLCFDGLPELLTDQAYTLFSDTVYSRVNHPHINYCCLNDNNIDSSISQLFNQHQLDVLAISQKKHRFFKRLFKSNSNSGVCAYGQIPLLVIPSMY